MLLLAETALWTAAVCQLGKSLRKSRESRPFRVTTEAVVAAKGANHFEATENLTLEDLLMIDVKCIPGVADVRVQRSGNTFRVDVILNAFEYEVREKVYSKELQLYNEFPDLDFDFRLIPAAAVDKITADAA